MASLGHQITVEQTGLGIQGPRKLVPFNVSRRSRTDHTESVYPWIDDLIHEFDVDESDGIEIFEFISMIQKFQQDFQLDPTEELIQALQ